MLATGNLTIRGSWLKPPSSAPSDQMTKNFSLYNKEIVTLSPSGMMELSVSDSGAGMTETQLVELFQDGVQFNVNNLQSGQGSGLGLFITKGIVERHGGSLTVASEGLGKGTTFKLTLPLYQPPKCETSTTTSTDVPDPQRPNTGQVERRPQHILVADDCAVNRKLLIRLLTRAGHTCDGAEDGLVALHQVEAAMENGNYYDTILLDHEMPVLNGPTAAKEMRKLGFDALIVGVTGNLMREDVEYFKEYGANEVLPKPFKMKDLIRFWDENMG
jgi:CheY-like chemotaxis protein